MSSSVNKEDTQASLSFSDKEWECWGIELIGFWWSSVNKEDTQALMLLKPHAIGVLAVTRWRSFSTENDSWLGHPCKICPDTPSDDFVSHCSDDQSIHLFSKSDNLPPSLREGLFIVSEALSSFNGGNTFWFVMMALRRWQSHHHSVGGCQKSWEMTCRHSCHFALQAVKCRLWQAVWSDSAWPTFYDHGSGQHIRTRESIV